MSPETATLLLQEVHTHIPVLVPQHVPQVGSDDAEKLIQDTIAMAAASLVSLAARGKHGNRVRERFPNHGPGQDVRFSASKTEKHSLTPFPLTLYLSISRTDPFTTARTAG